MRGHFTHHYKHIDKCQTFFEIKCITCGWIPGKYACVLYAGKKKFVATSATPDEVEQWPDYMYIKYMGNIYSDTRSDTKGNSAPYTKQTRLEMPPSERRIAAFAMFNKGMRTSEIAQALGTSQQNICYYRRKYNESLDKDPII